MKKIQNIIIVFVICLVISNTITPITVHGASFKPYTLTGFIETLIKENIIDSSQTERALNFLSLILLTEKTVVNNVTKVQNADKVETKVSQLIENASLEYDAFTDIKGLLLLVKNTTNEKILLDAKRGCQVVYRIYSQDDKLLYSKIDEEKCKTNERVTYTLGAGKTRMFEIIHKVDLYKLQRGEYRFEIEYPGYGSGEKTITIK